MNAPMVIASYPRSGSTWLRFVLCHLFYPEIDHDFDTVNKHIPPIDYPIGLLEGIDCPLFYKTHEKTTATNVILLHRHVGDVLESEWWYKKKMSNESRSLQDYLEASEYGLNWRVHIDYFYPAMLNICYEDLGDVETYRPFSDAEAEISIALEKASFKNMRKAEEKGFGDYLTGDTNIPFCRCGKTGQWRDWSEEMQDKLIEKNVVQLKKLGYLKL